MTRLYWLLTLDRVDYSFQIVGIQCGWITFICFTSPCESTFFANLFAAFTFQITLTTSINCFATFFPFVWFWKKYGSLDIFYQKNQFIKELAPKKSWWPLYSRFIWCISLHCKEEVPSFWCWQILKMPYWWVAFTDQAKTVGLYFIKARNMCKIFSLVPSKKPVIRENWDKLSVYFTIFKWWNWPKHEFCQIAKCQLALLYRYLLMLSFDNWSFAKFISFFPCQFL